MNVNLSLLRSAVTTRSGELVFKASHHCILALCDGLEDAADSLPNRLAASRCQMLADTLLPLLRECHLDEENCLVSAGMSKSRDWTVILRRLQLEHRRDQYFAEEITDAFLEISETRPPTNPEALGFMLRGFIEVQRRHVANEQQWILPGLTSHGLRRGPPETPDRR